MTEKTRQRMSEAQRKRWAGTLRSTDTAQINHAVEEPRRPLHVAINKSKGILKSMSLFDSSGNHIELTLEKENYINIQEV